MHCRVDSRFLPALRKGSAFARTVDVLSGEIQRWIADRYPPILGRGNGANYTLLQALSAAGVPAESDYLSMVNRMMEEQMPIDRNSIQQMARMVNAHQEIDVQTLVQLNKLGITIDEQNAAQFENYQDDKQAITNEFDQLIEELPQALESESLSPQQMRNFGSKFLLALTDGLEDVPLQNDGLTSQEVPAESVAENAIEKILQMETV